MPSGLMALTLFAVVSLVSLVAATESPISASSSTTWPLEDQKNSNLYSRGRDSDYFELDRSLLAKQISGIVIAYLVFVGGLLSLLFFVGRRMRRTVHSSNYSLQVEMMKPIHPPAPSLTDASPTSPVSAHLPGADRGNSFSRSWSSLTRGNKPRGMSNNNNNSVGSIDESVVETDRRRAQEQMEMLYAAVLEHDEQKGAEIMEMGKDSSSGSDGHYQHQPQYPQHYHQNSVQSPDSTISNPFTDRSSRVLDEPSGPMSPAPAPASVQEPEPQLPTSPRSTGSRLSKRISSLSLFSSNHKTGSNGNGGSSNSIRSPRLPLGKKSISSPLASPDVTATQSYGDYQPPLTPRLYNPPAPPAPPTPQAPPIHVSPAPPPAKSSGMGRARTPAPLSLSSSSHLASSSANGPGQGGSLPFRDAFPPQSAPATKTTILERPAKQLNGPRTGMPTPYSPYMPFTPVTPLTPSRMVTKRQRKREGRENGLRVLNEDDMVKGDEDMWGY